MSTRPDLQREGAVERATRRRHQFRVLMDLRLHARLAYVYDCDLCSNFGGGRKQRESWKRQNNTNDFVFFRILFREICATCSGERHLCSVTPYEVHIFISVFCDMPFPKRWTYVCGMPLCEISRSITLLLAAYKHDRRDCSAMKSILVVRTILDGWEGGAWQTLEVVKLLPVLSGRADLIITLYAYFHLFGQ